MALDNVKKMAGTWRLNRSENFDDFLREVGVPYLIRKVIPYTRQEQTLSVNEEDEKIKIVTSAGMRPQIDEFKLDEDYNKEISGEKMEAKAVWAENKLTITQKSTNPESKTIHIGDVICKRYFDRRNVSYHILRKRNYTFFFLNHDTVNCFIVLYIVELLHNCSDSTMMQYDFTIIIII
ncbi:hypothetical protein KUTeg_010332 [Tegillarca granosa]|uniref:Cytosolic fatty-acid binding proteins domain-containing protein n=1 Tax=Tegillarca granosa TaxID=220873 RepID=A0ABQ9F6K9_TEGGR|nr:hypothetical protein KUTeg_010332 [Tegillarca granosa]